MESNNSRIKITFREEMLEQPEALQRFAGQAFNEIELDECLRKLVGTKKDPRIVLTGMGSSLFVAYIAMNILSDRGITATCVESYELQKKDERFFSNDTIVVAVSQSGESPEVLELLKTLPSGVPVIGVTNYKKSRLYNESDAACEIYAGVEYLTSTKSYTNSVAAMILLAYRLSGRSPEEVASLGKKMTECATKMKKMITNTNDGDRIAEFIKDLKFLTFIGSGNSYTTACHSEIVAEEAGKFHASCFTPAQFIHGPIELIYEEFGAVIYDFDRKYSEKCDDVCKSVLKFGGKVLTVTNRSDIEESEQHMVYRIDPADSETSALLEVIPLELGIDSLCKMRGVATGKITRVVKRMAL